MLPAWAGTCTCCAHKLRLASYLYTPSRDQSFFHRPRYVIRCLRLTSRSSPSCRGGVGRDRCSASFSDLRSAGLSSDSSRPCGPPKIFSERRLEIDINDNEHARGAKSKPRALKKREEVRKRIRRNVTPTNNLNCRIIGINRNLHTGKTNLGGLASCAEKTSIIYFYVK